MKAGGKTLARQIGSKKAVEGLKALGIFSCELKFHGCTGAFTSAIAHDDKGVYWSTEELIDPPLSRVCAACTHCHRIIEYEMGRDRMKEIVQDVAKHRTLPTESPKLIMAKKKEEEKKDSKGKEKKINNMICKKCGYSKGTLMICPHCGEFQG